MNQTPPRSTAAFSLPEVLAVIAIIGILSSVVIVSMSSARQKARESGAIAAIQSLALEAEVYYRAHSRSYAGMCADTGITELRDKAKNLGPCVGNAGVCFRCNENGTTYMFDHRFRTGVQEYYCVDSERAAKRRSGGALRAAGVFTCP